MALNFVSQQALDRFKEKFLPTWGDQVLEMRVFGSRARGDARNDSDLDLFIMVRDGADHFRTEAVNAAYYTGLELELDFVITPLVLTQAHFEKLLRGERRIARDIVAEGVPA